MLLRHVRIDVRRQLRAQAASREIVMLTAKSEEAGPIRGFDIGATTTSSSPSAVVEPVLRLKAIPAERRAPPPRPPPGPGRPQTGPHRVTASTLRRRKSPPPRWSSGSWAFTP